MVILNGIPGIGKTTHAKEYCSYITEKDKNNIVRWIDSDSENKVQNGIREIIEECKDKQIEKNVVLEKLCHDLVSIVKKEFSGKNLLFVFDYFSIIWL